MRDDNATAQEAILEWLADIRSQKPAPRKMEL
jgi:hypothetical protein